MIETSVAALRIRVSFLRHSHFDTSSSSSTAAVKMPVRYTIPRKACSDGSGPQPHKLGHVQQHDGRNCG